MTLVSTLKLVGASFLIIIVLVLSFIVFKLFLLHKHRQGTELPIFLRTLAIKPNVELKDGVIIFDNSQKKEQIDLSNLERIDYHYHAVVGFISDWEFKEKGGKSTRIDGETQGIEVVLNKLESVLPGFSLVKWKAMFDEGDVEDSLVVWKNV